MVKIGQKLSKWSKWSKMVKMLKIVQNGHNRQNYFYGDIRQPYLDSSSAFYD